MNKINIVIPMAGIGSRFTNKGYKFPKPFISVKGKMMIEWVLDGINIKGVTYLLIIREDFQEKYSSKLLKLSQNYPVKFYPVRKTTLGASCTVLSIQKVINNDTPLLIVDSDNFFYSNTIRNFIEDAQKKGIDGSLLTFKSDNPQFSYVSLNNELLANKIIEKEVISEHAICGVYYFKSGKDFVDSCIELMIYGDMQKGEYYISGVFANLLNHKKIGIYTIQANQWDCVGTPEQLSLFLKNEKN